MVKFFCENTRFVVSELVVASGEQQNTYLSKQTVNDFPKQKHSLHCGQMAVEKKSNCI